VGRRFHTIIWSLSVALALIIAVFETPKLFVLIGLGLLEREAAFKALLFATADKGADWPAAALTFPVFLLVGYSVPAFIPLPGLRGGNRRKEA